MKFPKVVNRYCPYCRKHTEHTVKLAKRRARGKAHPTSQSQRRFLRKLKGYGSFPRPKASGEGKPTKNIDLRLTCKECGKAITKKGFRVRKLNFV